MTSSERDQVVLEGFKAGKRYGEILKEHGFDNNQMYAAVTKLIKRGALKRIKAGHYDLGDNIPVTKTVTLKPVEKVEEKNIIPFPDPKTKDDVDEVATTLLEKISKLQPLLLLHNDLFVDIQNITMNLVQRIIEVKPCILTPKEIEEYHELSALKERSLKIANQKSSKHK